MLNPVTGIIESFRAVLFSSAFPVQSFLISLAYALIISIVGLFYFVKAEGVFSDMI